MRGFVLLEVGRARVEPFVMRDLSSWVHDHLESRELLGQFADNRPKDVRCIHPWVTCLEKLEAIARKFERGKDAPDFVRHYEDAARIIGARERLPALAGGLETLLASLAAEDRKLMPRPDHPAFAVDGGERWSRVAEAYAAIGRMFWGTRISLDEACATIRAFLDELRAGRPGD